MDHRVADTHTSTSPKDVEIQIELLQPHGWSKLTIRPILGEINISQTQVKGPVATKSIFHRQEVINSLDPALPLFEAASSPVVSRRMAPCHLKTQPSGFGPLHKLNRFKGILAAPAACWSILGDHHKACAELWVTLKWRRGEWKARAIKLAYPRWVITLQSKSLQQFSFYTQWPFTAKI